jgi:hypothetical protein
MVRSALVCGTVLQASGINMTALSSSASDTITITNLERLGNLLKSVSRKLLLTVALISTVGWIYLLSKAAMFIGAKLFS